MEQTAQQTMPTQQPVKRKPKSKASGSSPKKKRRTKKNDGIKKPTSAYIYFVSDYRLVLKKNGIETKNVVVVAKMCGAAWKIMSDDEKRPYVEKWMDDKRRYDGERAVVDKQVSRVKPRDPSKPKRPQTAYFFFLADFRKENKGKTLEEGEKIPALAGRAWATLNEENKKRYTVMAQVEKEKYVASMEAWKKLNPDEGKAIVAAQKKKVVALPLPEVKVEEDSSSDSESCQDSDTDDDGDSSDSDTNATTAAT